jgi:predicted permease
MPFMNVFMQISALFMLMAVGFAAGRLKILESIAIRGISALIIKATLPALILVSLQKPFSQELLGESFQTLLVATLFYAGIIVLSLVAVRLLGTPEKKSGILAFSLSFSNAAFIGFPVVTSILGPSALFLTSIHNILFNLLAFSAGIIIVAAGSGRKKSAASFSFFPAIKKALNINVISSIAGFIFFVSSIKIPQLIALPLEMLGGLTTPLAMIVTGAMLSRTGIATVLGDWRLYVVSLFRLALWPLLTALVLNLCGIHGTLYAITVIIAAMPAASNTSLIAEVYGGDTDTASSIVFMTTLLSVFSIPLLAVLLQK